MNSTHEQGGSVTEDLEVRNGKSRRHRVQLEFSAQAFADMVSFLPDANAESAGDFCRQAVKFYRWYLSEKRRGAQLYVKREGEASAVALIV